MFIAWYGRKLREILHWEHLPRSVKRLNVCNNALSGTVNFSSLPRGLERLLVPCWQNVVPIASFLFPETGILLTFYVRFRLALGHETHPSVEEGPPLLTHVQRRQTRRMPPLDGRRGEPLNDAVQPKGFLQPLNDAPGSGSPVPPSPPMRCSTSLEDHAAWP